MLGEVAKALLQIAPQWLKEMNELIADNNLKTVVRLAHTLKSSADNVGSKTLHERFEEMETAAVAGSLDEVKLLWPACSERFNQLLGNIQCFLSDARK